MGILVAVFFAAVVATFQRIVVLLIYRSWFKQGLVGDACFHFAVIREIKNTGRYEGVPNFLIQDGKDAYPILFHRMAALVPLRLVKAFPFIPNLVLWAISAACSACYSFYISPLLQVNPLGFSIVSTCLFMVQASNITLDMNGLNYISLSERMIARFVSAMFFFSMVVFLEFRDFPSLAVSVLAGALAFHASLFSRQAVVFVSIVFSFVSWKAEPSLIASAAFVLAVVTDPIYFVRSIKHTWGSSRAYRHHTKRSRYYSQGFSQFLNLKRLIAGGLRNFILELELREPTKVIFRYPELIFLFALSARLENTFDKFLLALVAAVFVVYFFTSTKWLNHFGEASRYIEYALWFAPNAAIAAHMIRNDVSDVTWSIYFGWIALVSAKRIYDWRKFRFFEADRLSDFIKPLNLNNHSTLMTVPVVLGAAIAVRADCRCLMYQGSAITLELYEKFMEEIPFLKRNWKLLAAEHGITHVIAEKSFLASARPLMGWEYDFTSLKKLAESETFVAFEVEKCPNRGGAV